ncbi:MAG: hypothetical protein AB2A00_39745 [Myxococcota bacterium]
MTLVVATIFVAALTGIVLSMGDMALGQRGLDANANHIFIAEQMAETGMARALAEARYVVSSGEPDLDALLDPDLDNSDGSGEKLYLPAASTVSSFRTTTLSPAIGGWGSSTEEIPSGSGVHYRKVVSGSDRAYLVRFDDNRDDLIASGSLPRATQDGTEGSGTDNPKRDRDMGVYVTAIGLSGGTTYTTAQGRVALRALIRSSSGVGILAGGQVQITGGGNTEICGTGIYSCQAIQDPNCRCGVTIYDPGTWTPPGSYTSVGQCSTPSPCGICEPIQTPSPTATCPPPLPSSPPPVNTTGATNSVNDARWMNNLTPGMCYFYMSDDSHFSGSASDWTLYMWDFNADPSCDDTIPNGTMVPAPDPDYNSTTVTTFPNDCWVPVADSSDAANTDLDASNRWQPGTTTGVTGPWSLDSRGVAHLVNGGGGYVSLCGLGALPGTWILTEDAIRVYPTTPPGIYFWDSFGSQDVVVTSDGATTVKNVAIVHQGGGDADMTSGCDDLRMNHPATGANYPVISQGDVRIDNVDFIGFGHSGVLAGGDIILDGNNDTDFFGSMTAVDDIDLQAGNNVTVCGAAALTAASTCPDANPQCSVADCTSKTVTYKVGDDIQFSNNNQCLCLSIEAGDQVQVNSNSNNTTLQGTIWAGGQVQSGNNLNISPFQGSDLGATPQLIGVHQVRIF